MSDEQVLVLTAKAMQPGDVVVLETEQPISAEQAQTLKERLCDRLPWITPDDVIVLAAAHLSVVRPPSK